MPTETDAELASRLAREAGARLVELREQLWRDGAHSWDVMDSGDAASQRFLADELARHRPDDAVLSEEGVEDPRRFDRDRVWIDHRGQTVARYIRSYDRGLWFPPPLLRPEPSAAPVARLVAPTVAPPELTDYAELCA